MGPVGNQPTQDRIFEWISTSNIRPKRHLAYGQKIVGRRVEECKSELAVLEKMNRLREQGFSYWKIADILNSMGVPGFVKGPSKGPLTGVWADAP